MDNLKTIAGAVGWFFSLAPQALSLLGSEYYIYQPGVYQGYQWLLIIPPVISAGALILGLRVRWAWALLLALFLLGMWITYLIFSNSAASRGYVLFSWVVFNISCSLGIVLIFLAGAEVIKVFAERPNQTDGSA
jgi:hypothetical protein